MKGFGGARGDVGNGGGMERRTSSAGILYRLEDEAIDHITLNHQGRAAELAVGPYGVDVRVQQEKLLHDGTHAQWHVLRVTMPSSVLVPCNNCWCCMCFG